MSLNFLLGLNSFFFLFSNALMLLGNVSTVGDFMLLGGFNSYFFGNGFWWLAITSNFLHFDFIHFVLNVSSLYTLGNVVKNFYSNKHLIFVYTFAGFVGCLFTFFAFIVFGGYVNSLGASGSVFGLLGMLVGGTLKRNRFGASLPFSIRDFYPSIISAVLVSFLPNINIFSHIGGFIVGIVFGFFANPTISYVSNTENKIINILYYFSVIVLVLAFLVYLSNFFYI